MPFAICHILHTHTYTQTYLHTHILRPRPMPYVLGAGAVSFGQIVKAAEPVFAAATNAIILKVHICVCMCVYMYAYMYMCMYVCVRRRYQRHHPQGNQPYTTHTQIGNYIIGYTHFL
jgi:hypothetical protein